MLKKIETKTIKRDGEYRVRLFIDGEYQAGADYFTDDPEDARDTAAAMRESAKPSDLESEAAKSEMDDFREDVARGSIDAYGNNLINIGEFCETESGAGEIVEVVDKMIGLEQYDCRILQEPSGDFIGVRKGKRIVYRGSFLIPIDGPAELLASLVEESNALARAEMENPGEAFIEGSSPVSIVKDPEDCSQVVESVSERGGSLYVFDLFIRPGMSALDAAAVAADAARAIYDFAGTIKTEVLMNRSEPVIRIHCEAGNFRNANEIGRILFDSVCKAEMTGEGPIDA